MEGPQLLDVPITEEEHYQRNSDHSRLLSFSETSDDAQYNDKDFSKERPNSLPTAVRRVNEPDDPPEPPIFHRRIPSNVDEQRLRPLESAQPLHYDDQNTYTRPHHPPDLWRPFWTRRSTLSVLLILLLLTVVALVLLFHYSQSLDGFNVSSSTAYYAWTYTPVAFFLILVALWRQVDYYFKLLAPWDELRTGPTNAAKTLLLDYVSPFTFISFLAALKRRYIPVVLSITAFISLKTTAIFSAALLLRSSTVITSNSTSTFSTRLFDASSLRFNPVPDVSSFTPDPVYSTLRDIVHNTSSELGIAKDGDIYYAYNPVYIDPSFSSYLQNSTYTARTNALFPNLSCNPISVTVNSNSSIMRADATTISLTNSYIPLQMPNGNHCTTWRNPTVYAMNPQREITPSAQLVGTMQSVYCSGAQDNGTTFSEPAGLLFTITDVHYTQSVLPNGFIVNSTRMVADITSLLCIPNYYVLDAEVQNDTALYGADAFNVRITSNISQKVVGLSDANLAVLYEGVMNASQGILGTREENPRASSIPNTVFDLMRLKANISDLRPFKNPKAMQAVAESTFRQVMSYYTAQSLSKSSQANLTTNTVYSRYKLHISLVPFAVVLALTGLSACCTAALVVVAPGPLVPKDPSILAMAATVLARSPELNRLLRKQSAENTTMARALQEHEFSSAVAITNLGQTSFKILVTEMGQRSHRLQRDTARAWWSPNLVLLPAVSIAVSIPLALIAILEVLQRRSNDHQGLLTLHVGPNTNLYARCIPVLVMMLVGAAAEFLDFYVKTLSPWNKLASGNSSAHRTLLSQLSGRLPPTAFVEALRKRQLGAVFSISAAVLACISAVFGAGLYSASDIATAGGSQLLIPVDALRVSNTYNVFNDLGAAGMLRQIDRLNMPYPDGTFDNLVFPNYIQTQQQTLSAIPTPFFGNSITAVIPALRPNLLCDIVSDSDIKTQYAKATQAYPSSRYDIISQYKLPDSCQSGRPSDGPATITIQNVFNTTSNETTVYGGQLLDLRFGQNSSSFGHYGEQSAELVGNTPATGCPSLAFTLAKLNTRSNDSEVTTLVCYQQVQQLTANVTYKSNSTKLDLESGNYPTVNEHTLSLLPNPESNLSAKSFDWRIQLNVERQLFGLGDARLTPTNSTDLYHFDAFFSYLLNDSFGQKPNLLIGSSNQQSLVTAVNKLYGRYMAQAINANMRYPIATSSTGIHKRQSASSVVTAQTSTSETRLVQSRTSTLILQILLGLSALFSALAYILTKFHRLLPQNPCTIAGTMSLLAGSDLCWSPADGLCDCCGLPRRSSWSHEPAYFGEEININADITEYQGIPNLNNGSHAQREQMIPEGAEWFDYLRFAAVFSPRTYSLGWWSEDHVRARRRHYGIDSGGHPDGERNGNWDLGDQRLHGEQGFGNFMTRGREMLGHDQRGQYNRVNRAELSPDLGPPRQKRNHRSGSPAIRPGLRSGRGHEPPLMSSPTLGHAHHRSHTVDSDPEEGDVGIRSPKRVRFEGRT